MEKINVLEKEYVVGCNYHVKWQSNKTMRFVLKQIDGSRALLGTRTTNKLFWTNISDLIEITTKHNLRKKEILKNKQNETISRI
jgi:cell division FtsZ-interacting protein ZapD